MKSGLDIIKEGFKDSTGKVIPKFINGFNGVAMKTLNPINTLKLMKPEGCKGLQLSSSSFLNDFNS